MKLFLHVFVLSFSLLIVPSLAMNQKFTDEIGMTNDSEMSQNLSEYEKNEFEDELVLIKIPKKYVETLTSLIHEKEEQDKDRQLKHEHAKLMNSSMKILFNTYGKNNFSINAISGNFGDYFYNYYPNRESDEGTKILKKFFKHSLEQKLQQMGKHQTLGILELKDEEKKTIADDIAQEIYTSDNKKIQLAYLRSKRYLYARENPICSWVFPVLCCPFDIISFCCLLN